MKRFAFTACLTIMSYLLVCFPAWAEEIRIGAGGAPTENILKPIKEAFEKSTGVKLIVTASGPKNALVDLQNGVVEAAAAGLNFNDWLEVMKKEGVEVKNPSALQPTTIGKDRIIVIAHRDNKVTSLSAQQLQAVFSGEAGSWKDVGGEDMPLLVVIGKLTPGTNAMFAKKFLGGKQYAKDILDATNADDVKTNVASNPSAIGFGPVALADGSVKRIETPELARDIVIITKGKPSANIQKLIDFIKGEGQKYIKQ